jgi:hypothetical protein
MNNSMRRFVLTLVALTQFANAFSPVGRINPFRITTSLRGTSIVNEGCAAVPFEKKKVRY